VTIAASPSPTVQKPLLGLAAVAIAGLAVYLLQFQKGALFAIGLGLGVALYHAAFGFSGAYRRAIVDKDLSGVTAQAVMFGLAMVLFAPVLSAGEVFGRAVGGAVAPVSVSMAFGAFLFGIGMQLGGGCASGTLFTAGGGSLRMVLVLVFFCIGCFWATFHMGAWTALPGIGAVSLAGEMGWPAAVALQFAVLAAVLWVFHRAGARPHWRLWRTRDGFSWRNLVQGPWPLLFGGIALAVLNWATLVVAGHPWSITWGFTLWAAKAASAFGWVHTTSDFWNGGFPERALLGSLFADTTTVMNLDILLGAFAAAALAGRVRPESRVPLGSLAAAVLGGLMMGYGARLAYGCNIGAFFSGVASTSLHGWVWIVAAGLGNVVGVKLRPRFGLAH